MYVGHVCRSLGQQFATNGFKRNKRFQEINSDPQGDILTSAGAYLKRAKSERFNTFYKFILTKLFYMKLGGYPEWCHNHSFNLNCFRLFLEVVFH